VVKQAKGQIDRTVPFPHFLKAPLEKQLEMAKALHEQDLQDGLGIVTLPHALDRKYPNAGKEWGSMHSPLINAPLRLTINTISHPLNHINIPTNSLQPTPRILFDLLHSDSAILGT